MNFISGRPVAYSIYRITPEKARKGTSQSEPYFPMPMEYIVYRIVGGLVYTQVETQKWERLREDLGPINALGQIYRSLENSSHLNSKGFVKVILIKYDMKLNLFFVFLPYSFSSTERGCSICIYIPVRFCRWFGSNRFVGQTNAL